MLTQYDKAIVAVIMAILTILQRVFHINLNLDENTVTMIVAAITPLLVFLVPNKGAT